MKKMLWLILFLNSLIPAFADDGYYTASPKLGQPFGHNQAIRMLSEVVVYKDDWFSTVFVFSNLTKQAQQVKLGFPINTTYFEKDDEMVDQGNILTPKQKIATINKYFTFTSTAN